MSALGVGIVGCGWAATDVVRAIGTLADARVAAVHDLHAERAAALANAVGAAVHTDLDGLLHDPAVAIVYVGLPHHLLAPTARRALAANRHVLVEKPVALEEPAVRDLRKLAEQRGLTLGVVFELREAGPFRLARELIAAGAIGDIRAVRLRTVIDKRPEYWTAGSRGVVSDGWRARRDQAGGGVVLMNSIHQIDLVHSLTGLRFVRAMADVATLTAPVEVEDHAAAALRLSNGAVVSLVASAHSPGATREERIEIDGAEGRLDLPDPYGPGRVRAFLRRPWGELAAQRWLDLEVATVDMHVALVRGFLDAVRTGGAPPAGIDDAALALATVLAIYRSAASGQSVDVAP